MKIQNLFKVKPAPQLTSQNVLDRIDLENKAKSGKSLTAEEYSKLSHYKKAVIVDQIFKIFGVITVLALIVLAIGTFLYPYSVFNWWGTNKFVEQWNNIPVTAETMSPELKNKIILDRVKSGMGDELYNSIFYDETGKLIKDFSEKVEYKLCDSDFITLKEAYSIAFQSGSGFYVNFFALGSWAIIIVATAGLILAIWFCIYALVYNIRNLIGIIKQIRYGTSSALATIANTGKESVSDIDTKEEPVKKPKKSSKKKIADSATTAPIIDEILSEEEIQKRIDEYKKEINANENAAKPTSVAPVTSLENKTDAELDRLLSSK